MTAISRPLEQEERLLLRGRAVGLCARLLTEDADLQETSSELQEVLSRLEDAPSLRCLEAFLAAVTPGWPFPTGLAPYETSHERGPGSAGGPTFQMADIAGFYRAFGFEVSGERPDHIVPELEFVALLLVKEAYARMSGQGEPAEVCSTARKTFLQEHLGVWLRELSRRSREAQDGTQLQELISLVLVLASP